MSEQENNKKDTRDAYSSILGYSYQLKLTFYHLLRDINNSYPYSCGQKNNGNFYIENGEDYKRSETGYSDVYVQIKYHQDGTTTDKYYKPIIKLYKNFQENNGLQVLAVFDTNLTDQSDLLKKNI